MSGKGKGKGKAKKKGKTKPKPDEIEFCHMNINLKCFAYDVIKYTALKFQVPESCIAVWEGKTNDYGSEFFIFAVCIRILKYQIACRHVYHEYFNRHYGKNKLAESNHVSGLLYEVIQTVTGGFTLTRVDIVRVSLSIVCELFLFLYSNNMDLHPQQLAKTWFKCYLYLDINKKNFEREGGLERMYLVGYNEVRHFDFLNKFIKDLCIPYNISASNEDLGTIFCRLAEESLPQEDAEEMLNELRRVKEIAERLMNLGIEHPVRHQATRFNLPESTGTPLHQASQSCSSFAESTQDLPITNPEVQPCLKIPFSTKERRERLKSKYPFTTKVTSSEAKQTSDQKPSVSIATGTAHYYEHQGATPKVRVQNTGSSGLQTSESSTRSSGEGSLGSLRLESSIVTGAAQSYGHQGATPKVRVQNTGSSGLKTGESSSRSSGEGSLGSSTLESSIVTGAAQSYGHQGATPKVRVQNTGSSGLQTGESSSRSSGEGSLGSLRLESLIATVRALYYKHHGATPKVREQNTGSSRLQTSESSSRSSIEGSLGSLTLESSIVTGSAQSYGHQVATPKDRVQNTGSSGLQTGESSSSSSDEQEGRLSLDFSGTK